MRRSTWLLPLCVALILRVVVLASGAVSFHSDEAIVGLMARHINAGEAIPTFFYGQPYMGSLDPIFVSIAFRVLGEHVPVIRVVESILYLLFVLTAISLAFQITSKDTAALYTGLLVAIPPVVLITYTTLSLGGYTETLLLGNLLLVSVLAWRRSGHWYFAIALGLCAGLGWWTNALIGVYFLPTAFVLFLPRRAGLETKTAIPLTQYALAVIGFFLGSAPWWIYNFSMNWAAFHFLFGGFGGTVGTLTPGDKLDGLLLFGLPTVFGVRYPWVAGYWAGLLTLPFLGFIMALLILALRQFSRLAMLWVMIAGFIVIFVGSGFGIDATGRYLLPLILPFAIILGTQIAGMRFSRPLLAILLMTNLIGMGLAIATQPPGITPQFDASTDLPNTDDDHILAFLKANNLTAGYATYWVAYRLDFLSSETLTLSPLVPYKYPYAQGGPDRYPTYTDRVAQAPHPVLITANLPDLDSRLAAGLSSLQIRYDQQAIGTYRVYYNFSVRLSLDILNHALYQN
jgi:4-amino-4-deoxy-L-arabinose transferase-like glycosyltransferase